MYASTRKTFSRDGFAVLPDFLKPAEIAEIRRLLQNHHDAAAPPKRGAGQVYAIRNLLAEVPALAHVLSRTSLMEVVHEVFGPDYFNVKGIYFDKPADFNWNVAWHQDLSISVDRRLDGLPGFEQWSLKSGLVAVRPPLEYSQNIRTLRIHLDTCDESNGALRVMPGSQQEGVLRYDATTFAERKVVTCCVPEGGAMLMSPLLMHSSHKSSGGRRRVIHLEFSNLELPHGLQWRERCDFEADHAREKATVW